MATSRNGLILTCSLLGVLGPLTAACSGASGASGEPVADTDAPVDVATDGVDGVDGGETDAQSDGGEGVTSDTVEAEVELPSPPDTVDVTPGDGTIGSSCKTDSDCQNDGLCLDWPGGYCTVLNCSADAECPTGSRCAEVKAGTTACVESCALDGSACREGYGCKPIAPQAGDEGATPGAGCIGLSATTSPPGGPCASLADCAGPHGCLSGPPGGFCAMTGCSNDVLCPAGTTCANWNGAPTCLPSCEIGGDCAEVPGEARCDLLVGLAGTPVPVCLPGGGSGGAGSGCTSDQDCESGFCRIVAEGKCVGSSAGCFVDGDCAGGVVCELAPAYRKGVCTQLCSLDALCPGQTGCAPLPAPPGGTASAFCQNPCKGPTDPLSCDDDVGETCRFGDPIGNTASGGKYLCVVLGAGDPGQPCESDAGCKEGGCIGTCAPSCVNSPCPFSTTCTNWKGEERCMRRCFSALDCAAGMSCASPAGTATKVCMPPS